MPLPAALALRRLGFLVLLVQLSLATASCGAGRGTAGETTGEAPPQVSAAPPTGPSFPEPERWSLEVLGQVPHDKRAFTQGLLWHDGYLYESTGQYGASSLRRLDLQSGKALETRYVEGSLFAEGLALVDDRLIQLTWKAGLARVYDLQSLEVVEEYAYEGEGWGLADDGQRLIMSDGTDTLTFRDRRSFEPLDTIQVVQGSRPRDRLNELEWVDGHLYANVWASDEIVRIDPNSGAVTAVIDAAVLRERLLPGDRSYIDVLNGIAYHPQRQTFWLTGKYWPKVFEVRFLPPTSGL